MTRGWHEKCHVTSRQALRYQIHQQLCSAVVDWDGAAARQPWVWLVQGGAAQHPAISPVLIPNCLSPPFTPHSPHDSWWCPGCMRTGRQSKVPDCLCLPWKLCLKGLFYRTLYIFFCSYWRCPCLCIYEKRAVHILGHCMLFWTLGV